MIQTDLFIPTPTPDQVAIRRRDRGIERALTHAEQERRNWLNLGLQAMNRFLGVRGNLPFLAEAFRVYAKQNHVPDPPDARAWGGVMTAAKREKLIESCGAERALTSNLSYKVLWKKKEE